MSHVFEPATSGRAKCRGCNRPIARGEVRFGERIPNPYAEGETTLWFHPMCAAYKRPEVLLDALETAPDVADRDALEHAARGSASHRRLPRIDGADQAPTGQAKCRSCREPIARGTWRIRLVFHEEGRFSPGGFVHLACRLAYFETGDVLAPLLHFSAGLTDEQRADLVRACEGDGAVTGPLTPPPAGSRPPSP